MFPSTWMAMFGIPQVVTMDHGVQFISNCWSRMLTTLGVKTAKPPYIIPRQRAGEKVSLHSEKRFTVQSHNQIMGQLAALDDAGTGEWSQGGHKHFLSGNNVKRSAQSNGDVFLEHTIARHSTTGVGPSQVKSKSIPTKADGN